MSENIRKAAIVVSSLDTKTADMVLEHITAAEADQVRCAVFELGPVTAEEERRTIDEFFRLGPKPNILPSAGSPATTPSPGKAAFDFLQATDGARLAGILSGERPQVVALVLSHLPSETAGEVLVQFPADVQSEIVRRLVDLEETDAGVLKEIEEAIRSRLAEQFPLPRRRVAGVSAVARILDTTDRKLGMRLYDNIAARDHHLAQRLQPVAMSFDELVRLDETSLQILMEGVDLKLLTLSLVGTAPAVVDRILGKLSAGEAALIRSDLAHLGPTRLSDVEEARRRIAKLGQRLGLGRRQAPGAPSHRLQEVY